MRTKIIYAVMCFLLLLTTSLAGCGGSDTGSNNNPTSTITNTPAPAAKITSSEIVGRTIYSSASYITNPFGYIEAYTFNADGTLTDAINMTSTSTSSASKILSGTYTLDNNGILTISIPLRTTEKLWKTTATPDAYNSFMIGDNTTSVICRWFLDSTKGGSQAIAYSNGLPIPGLINNSAPIFTSLNNAVFTVGSSATFTVSVTSYPLATLSISGTLPNGITFDPATGILRGTPTIAGSYSLSFTANNGVLPNATQSFSLIVNPVNNGGFGTTWITKTSPVTNFLNGVVWSGTQFVAVGNNGIILTSADGSTWVSRASGSTEALNNIAWSGNKYVVVGGWYGSILTSADGITWTKTSSGVSKFFKKVIWGNNQFVAVGMGAIMTSPDGITWIQRTVSTTNEISNVVWTGSQFIAIGGSNGAVSLTSADGITWVSNTGLSSVYNGMMFGLAWNGNKVIANGWGGTLASSTNGLIWSKAIYGSNNYYSIAWANNKFIAVGNSGVISSSTDGNTWASDVSPTTSVLSDIACSSTNCVVVGGTTSVSTILLLQ